MDYTATTGTMPVQSARNATPLLARHRKLLALAGAITVLGSLGNWHLHLRDRDLTTASALAAARSRCEEAETRLREADRVRPPLNALVDQPRRIEDERQLPDWTPALRALALSVAGGVEFGPIQAHGETANPGACTIRIEGTAPSRNVAEMLRTTLQSNLQRQVPDRTVLTRFDRISEGKATRGTPAGANKTTFVLVATVSLASKRLASAH